MKPTGTRLPPSSADKQLADLLAAVAQLPADRRAALLAELEAEHDGPEEAPADETPETR